MRDMIRDSTRSLGDISREVLSEIKEQREASSARDEEVKQLQSKLDSALNKLDQVLQSQESLKNRIDVMRAEVRLISQQKLTWQNTTSEERPPDFLVDGVYLKTTDEAINPVQHNGWGANQVVIINLGGFFKIQTIKIWNRLICCKERGSGLVVYADQTIIGVTSGSRDLYTVTAGREVFARRITIRQPHYPHINLREVQVFGSGPYSEEELA